MTCQLARSHMGGTADGFRFARADGTTIHRPSRISFLTSITTSAARCGSVDTVDAELRASQRYGQVAAIAAATRRAGVKPVAYIASRVREVISSVCYGKMTGGERCPYCDCWARNPLDEDGFCPICRVRYVQNHPESLLVIDWVTNARHNAAQYVMAQSMLAGLLNLDRHDHTRGDHSIVCSGCKSAALWIDDVSCFKCREMNHIIRRLVI
jgi:hypothetical protein